MIIFTAKYVQIKILLPETTITINFKIEKWMVLLFEKSDLLVFLKI